MVRNWEIVDTNQRLMELVPFLMGRRFLAIDTEGTGLSWEHDIVCGVSMSWNGNDGIYIPFHHETEEPQCNPLVVRFAMELILRNPEITKIYHNAKYDLHMMWSTFGVRALGPQHDTLVMAFLDDNTIPKGLKDVSARLFGPELKDFEDELDTLKKNMRAPSYAHVPISTVGPYAVADAVYTFKTFEHFKHQSLSNPLYWTELRLIDLIIDMERAGIQIDREFLIEGGKTIDAEVPIVEKELNELAGWEINPRSTQQVARLLFDQLGMPITDRTDKDKPSTAEPVLLNLPPHPAIDLVLRARALSKCKSTYVDGILDKVDPNGRLHCRFNQMGAETGRFSSSKPNLQNIPREGSMPISIRQAFIPKPNCVLVFIDYAQVEMRLFAHYSNDPGLLHAVHSGHDFHTSTAANVFHLLMEEITKAQRKFAKSINFGIIYGIGVRKLAQRLQISIKEAKALLDQYFATFPGVPIFMNKCREDFDKRKYVENMFGRRRKIPYDKAYRSVNTLIQGTAADVIKHAMVRLIPLLRRSETQLLLQVHDELGFEVPIHELEIVPEIVEIMEDFNLRVPIDADVEWSDKNWGMKKKWTSPQEIRSSLT